MNTSSIAHRISNVRETIKDAALKSGRDLGQITLLAASKQVPAETILQAVDNGIKDIGENQIQEAEAKFGQSGIPQNKATLHLIGHLQSNKIRRAIKLFGVIQSIDSPILATKIDNIAGELGKTVPIYIEVNLGSESSKTGIRPDYTIDLAGHIARSKNLSLEGLMTVPPYTEDPEGARPFFKALNELRSRVNELAALRDKELGLSMGMSHDFGIAVEEGSTLVRGGRAIWQPPNN